MSQFKTKRLSKDENKSNNSYQNNLSPEEIKEKLEEYKRVDDISTVSLNAHLRYFIINEKTGTIVAGGDIRLNKVAISHGDLVLEVGADGKKLEKPGSLFMIEKKTTLKDLVQALNAIGTTPEDLISIFQALKRNGALFADLEFI